VYCLFREVWYPNGPDSFAVEHAQPQHLAPDLVTDYENLLYACNRCNSWKQTAEVLDPTDDAFAVHVQVDADGNIAPLTEEGRRLIRVLHLDGDEATRWRRRLLALLRRALEDYSADTDALRQWFGFPDDLPDLASLRPAGGNTRPAGTRDSYCELRRRGTLPMLSALTPEPTPPGLAPTTPNEPET
jgi:hypothetical protein